MLIDWFTVGAQVLNFIVLVWLLRRFLYKPILTAIDAREKRIAKELADADREKNAAQKERAELHDKNQQFGEERGALMAKAILEAKAERERLLEGARQLADETLTKQKMVVHDNAVALADQLKRLAVREVFDIARKALSDLASADLEERLGTVFMRRLRELTPEAKGSLAAALKAPNASAILYSRFELGAKMQASIRNALNETFSADIGLAFETTPDILCGIELAVSGLRLSWDIAEYLKILEEKVDALSSADSQSARANSAPKASRGDLPQDPSPAPGVPARALNGPAHAVVS